MRRLVFVAFVAGCAAYTPVAAACEPISPEVHFHLPLEDQPMPRNSVALAALLAPGGPEVSLARIEDGMQVPISVVVETSGANENGFVLAQPLQPLDAATEYRWTIDTESRTFTTGDDIDDVPPTPGPLTVTLVGEVVRKWCFGEEYLFHEYSLEAPRPSEPVALMSFYGEPSSFGQVEIGAPNAVHTEQLSEREGCRSMEAVDFAGHRVALEEVCFPALPSPSGSSGSSGGQPPSTGDTTDGSTTAASTTGSAEETGSSGTSTDARSESGSSGPSSAAGAQDGCACSSTADAPPYLLGLFVLWRRRRRNLKASTAA